MPRKLCATAALLAVVAVIAACAPPPSAHWTVSPQSITVHRAEDADGADEPYVIQIGFRSKVGVPGSSVVTMSSQCYNGKLPPPNAAPAGTTIQIPTGAADITFPETKNLDVGDIVAGDTPFELLGTLSFVMERDGVFDGGCAISDALRLALTGALRDALNLLIANAETPPTAEDLVALLVDNLGDFIGAVGSLIGAVIEGLGDPDDLIGVAAQIHLPTRGALTDLIRAGLSLAGLFVPGLEQGFIPVEDLPNELQIKVGSLNTSTSTFRFDGLLADYTYVSAIRR